MTLVSGLGALAPLFLGAQPAQAQVAQVQVQVQNRDDAMRSGVADLTSQMVMKNRHGEFLNRDRILKLDAYPGLHTRALQSGDHPQPLIEGAPNLREVPGSGVFGVAQPSVDGLRQTLRQLGAAPGSSGPPVVWTTLREEPVVYVAGRSFTVRELARPTANLEQPGTTGASVEEQERRLQTEVRAEAQRYGGRFLVQDESADGQLISRWVQVKPDEIQTPREVFDGLRGEGYAVDYARIPVTDERSPDNGDIDALIARTRTANPQSKLVFNCHAGRGRTTTGMIIGQLVRAGHAVSDAAAPVGSDRFEQGDFRNIRELVGSLRDGEESKSALDAVIDRSGAVQNLRTAIAKLKREADARGPSTAHAQTVGRDYLHRYYRLIALESYLREMQPQGFPQSFTQWLEAHPQFNVTPQQLELASLTLPGDTALRMG